MKVKEKKAYLPIKRLGDILLSGLGLIILALPMAIVAILIKRDDGGPVFYKQTRVGKDMKDFKIYKFRTMVVDADKKGGQITADGDDRITKIGHTLRKYKLDEFPQLINVFKGDMSIVGPRPEVPAYVALYNDRQRRVLSVRPGITDLASITYRSESEVLAQAEDPKKTYIEEIMPHKLELNLEYIDKMGPLYDLSLIFRTFWVIIKE